MDARRGVSFMRAKAPHPRDSRDTLGSMNLPLAPRPGRFPVPSDTRFETDDLVVLLLGAPGGTTPNRIEGITRLEKLAFLAERETAVGGRLNDPLKFKAHNFGPFSSKIYEAVDVLAGAKLVTDSERSAQDPDDGWEDTTVVYGEDVNPYKTRDFELTERGQRYYAAIAKMVGPEVVNEVSKLKQQFADVPLRTLVRYVYIQHPDFTTKSLIRDDILSS